MTQHNPWQALIDYYEINHGRNETIILAQLRRDGVSLDTLTEHVLQDYDMDHYDGAEAVERLVLLCQL